MKVEIKQKERTSELSDSIIKKYNISPMIKEFLERNGVTDEQLEDLLNPTLSPNPAEILNLQAMANRLFDYIFFNALNPAGTPPLIYIWGDYDVDGCTSTAILFLMLRKLGANVKFYIPSRHTEGYGLSYSGLDKIIAEGTSLLLTVDCGISEKEKIAYATSKGVEVMVLDHHQVPKNPEDMPDCLVVDPHQDGDKFYIKDMCGAGLSFELARLMLGDEEAMEFADLAAVGSIADVMPLIKENRAIVHHGLERIRKNPSKGLKALFEKSGKDHTKATSMDIGFGVAPMINAGGRLDENLWSAALLASDNDESIEKIGERLLYFNKARKGMQDLMFQESMAQLANVNLENKKVIVVKGKEPVWHKGIVGIVASRLVETFNKPVLVCSENAEGHIHGSARSIDGVNLHGLITKVKHHLDSFGGHEAAAGFALDSRNYNIFKKELEEVASALDDDLFVKRYNYDLELDLQDVTTALVEEMDVLEPYGEGNRRPVVAFKGATLKLLRNIGDGKHLSFAVTDGDGKSTLKAVWFNHTMDEIAFTENVTVVGELSINEWNNSKTPQLQVQYVSSYKKSENKDGSILSKMEFKKPKELTREDFVKATNRKALHTLITESVTYRPLPTMQSAQVKKLEAAGITNARDVFNWLPVRYEDRRHAVLGRDLVDGEKQVIVGVPSEIKPMSFRKGKVSGFTAIMHDETGYKFRATFFMHKGVEVALRKYTEESQEVFLYGKVKIDPRWGKTITVADFGIDLKRKLIIKPIYRKVRKMSHDYMRELRNGLMRYDLEKKDYLSIQDLNNFNILNRHDAIRKVHFPYSELDIEFGTQRMVFDKLFETAYYLEKEKEVNFGDNKIHFTKTKNLGKVIDTFGYNPTNDQMIATMSIIEDTLGDRRVNGLVQGDVGSGKTLVAIMLMAVAAENGYQSFMMAPTNVLAKQHYNEALKFFPEEEVVFLSAELGAKSKARKEVLRKIESGEAKYIIGTHSLISPSVEPKNLGLVIADEQHRFGAKQREELTKKGNKPHIVSMSATPIPRTTFQVLFDDNTKLYEIKEKPAGRQKIHTEIIGTDQKIMLKIFEEFNKGHQAYVVCPQIDSKEEAEELKESGASRKKLRSVEEVYALYNETLSKAGVRVGYVTGKMKKKEADEILSKFKNHEIDVLISTTVIEVGVNVPNATVLALLNSEMFGLAQAHQLRGRVGRGNLQGYFILNTFKDEPKAKILLKTEDGFKIAEEDLLLRGEGDVLGVNQSGFQDITSLILKNKELYEKIRDCIREKLKDEQAAELLSMEFPPLKQDISIF